MEKTIVMDSREEIDKEWLGGAVSYKYRVHDARIGRFLSIDPLTPDYPHNSSYAFSENRVVDGVELEGLEHVDDSGVNTTSAYNVAADSSSFVLGGEQFNNVKMIENGGKNYFKLDKHMYYGKMARSPYYGLLSEFDISLIFWNY